MSDGMTIAGLCKAEFPGQRMHRDPVPASKPLNFADHYVTAHKRFYPEGRAMPPKNQIQFTVGSKNDIGTSSKAKKVDLDGLRLGNIPWSDRAHPLGYTPITWCSMSHDAHAKPPLYVWRGVPPRYAWLCAWLRERALVRPGYEPNL